MSKKFLFVFLLAAGLSGTCLRSQTVEIDFNSGWRFLLADDPAFAVPGYDDSSWRTLDLPHDWSIEGPFDVRNPSGPQGGYMPCGVAWYRKAFTLPEARRDDRIFIRFDGVYMKSQVWINGVMVGEYPNGYNSFQYDISPYLDRKGRNIVAVRVDNSLQPGSRWYSGSGIYRDVTLVATGQMHFLHDGVFVTTPKVSEGEAVVKVEAEVINHAYPETVFQWTDNTDLFVWTRDDPSQKKSQGANRRVSKTCALTLTLLDGDSPVARSTQEQVIGDFTRTLFTDSLKVPAPRLWSPGAPNLYRLVCEITCEGRLMDRREMNVGIREVSFSPVSGMKVNGVREKLRGVCLHQTAGALGSAVPRDVWRARLLTLKEMGCNALRLTHYPYPPYMYDLCDSLGFFVTNEIFDVWDRGQEWGYSESPYGKMRYDYHLYFDAWAQTDLARMVRRDRSHPCLILYILGNEIPNQRIEGVDKALELKKVVRREDPTRPVSIACDFFVGANKSGFMDCFDIAGYNYIDRIHTDSLYAQEHAAWPDRVLLGSETYHSVANPIWARKTDACVGEFVWVGFDYLGEIVWNGDRGWAEGMIDIAGFPKAEYYQRQAYWREDPVIHAGVKLQPPHPEFPWAPCSVADHWNWKKGDLVDVAVSSNCDEVELRLGGRRIGRARVHPDSCRVVFPGVPFRAGTLLASGYRGGRKVAEHRLVTAGAPARIVFSITPGVSVDCIEVRMEDAKGILVPDYEGDAVVGVSGGEMLGIDNGTQHDPDGRKYSSKTEGAFHAGRLRLYVRHAAHGAGAPATIVVRTGGLEGSVSSN